MNTIELTEESINLIEQALTPIDFASIDRTLTIGYGSTANSDVKSSDQLTQAPPLDTAGSGFVLKPVVTKTKNKKFVMPSTLMCKLIARL